MDKNNKKSGFLVKNREFWKNGVFVGLVDGEGKGGNLSANNSVRCSGSAK